MNKGPLKGYAICTTPRSGSNYLSQLLESTSRLGRPLEYFNGPARRRLNWPDYPQDAERQMQSALALGATSNGVFGLKLFPSQFLAVQATRWIERMPGLHFIHLERRDLLGQAVSWAKALQTESYRSTSLPTGAAIYDRELISRCLGTLVREQARWTLWFARTGITPLCLTYEEVVAKPDLAVNRVAAHLGVSDVLIDRSRIDLEIQRNAESEVWKATFLAEAGPATSMDFEFSELGVPEPRG